MRAMTHQTMKEMKQVNNVKKNILLTHINLEPMALNYLFIYFDN